jgi:hypothetical protein
MFRQRLFFISLGLIVISLLAISAGPQTEAGALITPRASSAAGTVAAAATKAVATAGAAATKAAGTAPAAATKAAATAVAAATKAAGTAPAAATKAAATAGAAATKAAGTATAIGAATVSPTEASDAIKAYASSVHGLSVTVKKAGGLTGTVTKSLTQTSSGSSAQSAVAKLAVKTYGATLSNGAASLSYGSGTISGDVTVDVQGSSLAVYSLVVSNSTTLNADSALQLATTTFPGLANLKYTTYKVSTGYAWYFKGTASGIDPKTKKVVTIAEAVILYVLPGASGKASVSATVGRGDFASAIK